MTTYVFVLTPRTPGVVIDVVPRARVELSTVVESNEIREVSVTVSVVTTGVGAGVGVCVTVDVGVAELVGFVCAVELGAVTEASCAGASGNGWVAPYAEVDPISAAKAMPAPIAAVARFRGIRSHVERRKATP
ncbi:hypothetical protein [Curtobacterium sp. MCBA15_013]|uniref:hypothetical protein n=1 Tax=Curtobacterium sp. MCBA15_013 TaxID=1898739 RepID=UPI0020C9033D|nr:hypothetical protein [Curtobacterium sp. MCBA15_013]